MKIIYKEAQRPQTFPKNDIKSESLFNSEDIEVDIDEISDENPEYFEEQSFQEHPNEPPNIYDVLIEDKDFKFKGLKKENIRKFVSYKVRENDPSLLEFRVNIDDFISDEKKMCFLNNSDSQTPINRVFLGSDNSASPGNTSSNSSIGYSKIMTQDHGDIRVISPKFGR